MRKVIVVVSILVILIGSVVLMNVFMGMKQDPPEREATEVLRKVRTDIVVYSDIPASSFATGRLGSNQYIDLIAEVSGPLLKGSLNLKKGQKFRKGDLLIRVFDDEAEYNLKASKSRFLTSIANALPDFKIDFPERYDALLAFYNSIDIEKPLPELPVVQSTKVKTFLSSRNILNEFYTIKASEIRFQRYNIYAPFSGSVVEVMLEVGSIANPGSRIARLISTEQLELEVPIEVENLSWLKIGDQVQVTSEDGGYEWTGTIKRVSDFVDSRSQSASVFIGLNSNNKNPLYEGQYLKASFTGSVVEQAMEVPRSAVFNYNEVFVVEDGKLQKKTINVLKINQESLIFNGLDAAAEVVVEPLINATPGTPVDVMRVQN